MNRRIWLIFIIMSCILFTACTKEVDKIVDKDSDIQVPEASDLPIVVDEDEDEEEILPQGLQSPLSGIYAQEDKVARRPMAIIFDNHPRARWQSGLSLAEIVYEYKVEGGYTRYLGIFLINDPQSIGPIRSVRPYFINSLLEYDAVLVRCGGSALANADIKEVGLDNIDCMSSDGHIFWRNKQVNKSAPHNLYTSMEALRKLEVDKGYNTKAAYSGFLFNPQDRGLGGFTASNLDIIYRNSNKTGYQYNQEDRTYRRFKDEDLHVDEIDGEEIKVKNIIIQEADSRVIGDDGVLEIDSLGSGRGMFISLGQGINIRWEKSSRDKKTYFYDEEGEEIKLSPGQTWIQVVDSIENVIID